VQDLSQLREWSGYVSNIANGYKKSRILFTAFTAGVFDLLEEEREAGAMAAVLHWSERGTAMLLDGLVAMELLTKHAGRYRNTPMASACLARSGAAYQGDILRHNLSSWDDWVMLEDRVRTGTSAAPTEERFGQALRNFILGMGNIAKMSAEEVLQAVDLSGYGHVLDLAGGPATYGIAFLKAHPRMRATLFDRPSVVEIAREQVDAAGLGERFDYIAGDCLADDIGSGYDLVFISNLIHSFSSEENAGIVKKAYDALVPGGTILIKDFIMENDRSGPAYGLVFALHMLVHTRAGNTYTYDEIRSWTEAAGFGPGTALSLTPQTRLWIARKPE